MIKKENFKNLEIKFNNYESYRNNIAKIKRLNGIKILNRNRSILVISIKIDLYKNNNFNVNELYNVKRSEEIVAYKRYYYRIKFDKEIMSSNDIRFNMYDRLRIIGNVSTSEDSTGVIVEIWTSKDMSTENINKMIYVRC